MAFFTWLLIIATAPYALASSAEEENWTLIKYTGWTWLSILGVLLAFRLTLKLLFHVRRIANLNHDLSNDSNQLYFSIPEENWAKFKRHWLIAPLLRKRHMREFKLSAAMNMGTLPSRIQAFWLVGYFALNIATCVVSIHWNKGRIVWLYDACNRTGSLATLNMIPLFLFAGRNNPLIRMLDISFDNYNLLHRWIGRVVVVEATLHGAFWMAAEVTQHGWKSLAPALANTSDNMPLTGTIAVSAFLVILLQSPSLIRHAFYETFLHIHILLAIVATVAIWIHLEGTTQQQLLLAAIICWIVERCLRFTWILRNNFGNGVTKAEVEALPGEAMRITLRVARSWKFRPGQHVYLYIPSIGLWSSHPFTLAWSQEAEPPLSEKALPIARQDILGTRSTSISLVVRRRTGFTNSMWKKAEKMAGNRFIATAFVEGPYGHKTFHSYGTVMLFAAGVGITQQVPQVRDLVRGYANGTCATRKVVLVWIIQSPEHLEWIRPWMTEILNMDKRRDVLKLLLFVTRPRSTKEIRSPSSSVQMFPGKPDVGTLIGMEQELQVGAMAVSCCGTGSLSDDCRRAVRERCQITEIDFSEEAFSW